MTKAEIQASYTKVAMEMGDIAFRIEDATAHLEALKRAAAQLRKRRDELQQALNATAAADTQPAQGASDAVESPSV